MKGKQALDGEFAALTTHVIVGASLARSASFRDFRYHLSMERLAHELLRARSVHDSRSDIGAVATRLGDHRAKMRDVDTCPSAASESQT